MKLSPFSPFVIVGICVACMGLLMLAIDPWIDDRAAMMLNAILGTACSSSSAR